MGEFAAMGAAIGSVFPVVGTLAGGLVGGAIGALLGAIGGERIAKAMDAMGKWFTETWEDISKLFQDVWNKYVAEPFESAIETVKETFENFPNLPDFAILTTIEEKFYALRDWVIDMIDKIPSLDDIWSFGKEVFQKGVDAVDYDPDADIVENTKNAVRAAKDGYVDASIAGIDLAKKGFEKGAEYVGNLFTGDQSPDARISAAEQAKPVVSSASGGTPTQAPTIVPPSKTVQETEEGGGFIGNTIKSAAGFASSLADEGLSFLFGKPESTATPASAKTSAPEEKTDNTYRGFKGPYQEPQENVIPTDQVLTPAEPIPNLDAPFFTPVDAKPQARQIIIKEEGFVGEARMEKDYSKTWVNPETGKTEKGAPILWDSGPNKGKERYFVGYGFNTIDGVPVEAGDKITKDQAAGIIDTFIQDAEDKIRASNRGVAYDNIKKPARKASTRTLHKKPFRKAFTKSLHVKFPAQSPILLAGGDTMKDQT